VIMNSSGNYKLQILMVMFIRVRTNCLRYENNRFSVAAIPPTGVKEIILRKIKSYPSSFGVVEGEFVVEAIADFAG